MRETSQQAQWAWIAAAPLQTVDAMGHDLLARLLRYDPEQRIAADDAMQHPYLVDVAASVDQMLPEPRP